MIPIKRLYLKLHREFLPNKKTHSDITRETGMKINKCTDLNVNQGILDDGIIKWTTTSENYWHCLLKPKTQDGLAGEGVSCEG